MNKDIYEKNMEVLKIEYRELYDKLISFNPINRRVFIDESDNGEKILSVNKNGHLYYLNSKYSEQDFINEWMKNYEKIKYKEVFLFFGLSNFLAIKTVINKIGDNNIILLYEPDIEIMYNVLQIVDITDILVKSNCILYVKNICENRYKEFLLFVLDYSNMKLLNYSCLPNYLELYMEEWKKIIYDIKNRYASVIMTRNSYMLFSGEYIENDLENCLDMISQYVVNQLKEIFDHDELINDRVAIIVSAGPSLDKNIKDLKLAKGKALILAVDTALKTLLNNNIIPDLVITVDSHKPPILFAHKNFFDIPLVVCGISNHKLRHIHKGKRIYFDGGTNYIPYMYFKTKNERMLGLETGGSVANNAFSLIQVLGFKKIILVGQDLAYTNNKEHSLDAYKGIENVINKKEKKYFEVEDIYGNKVLTEGNMNLYRIWYETQLTRYPELKVIDATEGGAKIHGTEIMTLRDAIERECIYEVDDKLISEMSIVFNDKEKSELKEEIENIEVKLEKIKRRVNEGVRKYEKISELFRKNKMSSKELKRIMADIDEIIKDIENDPLISLIELYNKSGEYNVLSVVNDIKDNLKDEINDVVDNGKKMLRLYIDGIDKLRKDLKSRKEFNKEEFIELIVRITQNIYEIDSFYVKNNYLEIDKLMKEFMVLALDIVDILHRTRIKEYESSVEKLKEIIIEYTDEKYDSMITIMKSEFIEIVSNLSID